MSDSILKNPSDRVIPANARTSAVLLLIPSSVKDGTGFAICIYTVHLIDFE